MRFKMSLILLVLQTLLLGFLETAHAFKPPKRNDLTSPLQKGNQVGAVRSGNNKVGARQEECVDPGWSKF